MFMLCYLNIDSSSPNSSDPEASSSNSSKIYFTSCILISSVLLCKYLSWEVFENRLRSQLIVSRFLRILFDEACLIYCVISMNILEIIPKFLILRIRILLRNF